MSVLVCLAEHKCEVVSKEQLFAAVWPDTFVTDDVLKRSISELRKALGDDTKEPRFIGTIPKGGYRLICPVDGFDMTRHPASARRSGLGRARRWMWASAVILLVVGAALIGANVRSWRDRLLGRASPPRIESLAVLPLENLSGDPQQEYFVDGMTDTLTAELSKISALRVISRTSAMQYKGVKKKPLPQIARELGVDGIVAGTVMRDGEQVRISVQLIHGPTDRNLWADNYQREVRNSLTMQGEVASAIAREVKVKLTPQEKARFASARPINPQAYEAYLKGRYHWNKRSREGVDKSLEYFQRAIEIEPTYALAHTGMADAYGVLGETWELAPSEAWPKARAASLKALEIDKTLGEAHASLALVELYYGFDWSGAERDFKRAVELSPNYATAHQWHGLYLSAMGRSEEAIAEEQRAHELDPLSPIMYRAAGVVFHNARRYDEAIEQYRKALELDANFGPALEGLGEAYGEKGMFQEAIAELGRLRTLKRGGPFSIALLAWTYARAGRRREALKLLDELNAESQRRYVSAISRSLVYTALGDKDQAFAWLEKAYAENRGSLLGLKSRPWLDPLHDDPRFQDLLRRMNFPLDPVKQ